MDPSMDIPDATDWLDTPLRQFSDLESALHCEICKEFYDTPMITSCSHTFCSKCIRTSLSADGKCPACRTADQASKLRNNWALQTVVATFLAARPEALSVARREQELAAQSKRPGKRKREVTGPEDMQQMGGEGRTTRSKSRRVTVSETSQPEAIEVGDSDGDGDADFEPELPTGGVVVCPLGCGKRMKIEQVEPHLDRCEDEKKQASRAKSRIPINDFGHARSPSRQTAKSQERLAELNYSLLKDQAMRKKLEELGIPTSGSKQLMVRRHTEWVNIWNANCDSNNPRPKRELLRELDAWERTQGGKAPSAQNSSASAIMRKDFDGSGWANKNKDEFSRLIADARRKKGNPATASSPAKGDDPIEDPGRPALSGDENSSPHFQQHASQSPSPKLNAETSQPYAEHPEALMSVREKVRATKEGRHIEPVDNESFRIGVTDSMPNGTTVNGERRSLGSALGGEHEALLAQSHFGHTPSQDEHKRNQHTGHACDLPSHLQSSPKKLPMFAVPEQPVSDLDGAGEDGQVQ
ncbi:Postreplication repair E3 ubiquitin-protein ligase rad18 [Teratosphaeria destructans]|uniref:Postreplication repair E3 ubiquitin-protein ligase RAD18 n=1 Tax=Teratosphaeria destructans TaxID=418781 RepID=A0A9W7W459_9PEZI|nr:Postreplication repair E3 ubiquitin-protein ligase rad18 [Teratosphaeria destructans]